MEGEVVTKRGVNQVEGNTSKLEELEAQFTELKGQLESLQKKTPENKLSIMRFSGDLDKALASLIIATGATAMGVDVVMFFTFWGTALMRDKGKKVGGRT